jgi:hypothetical protein
MITTRIVWVSVPFTHPAWLGPMITVNKRHIVLHGGRRVESGIEILRIVYKLSRNNAETGFESISRNVYCVQSLSRLEAP